MVAKEYTRYLWRSVRVNGRKEKRRQFEKRMSIKSFFVNCCCSFCVCVYGILSGNRIPLLHRLLYSSLLKVNQSCCCLLMVVDFEEIFISNGLMILVGVVVNAFIFGQKCVKKADHDIVSNQNGRKSWAEATI